MQLLNRMEAGWSKRRITPDKPVLLSGYKPVRMSEGVNDDIYVKVLTLRKSEKLIFIVMIDLIAVDKRLVKMLEEQIAERHGKHASVIVSATHTHSGPVGTLDTSQGLLENMQAVFGDWDQEYVDYVNIQILEAVKESIETLSQCDLKIVDTEIEGIVENRNVKDGHADNRLFALELTNAMDKKVLVCHFACHLTVLNRKNTFMSKDLAFGIEKALPEYDFVGYLNGAAGDLSTRFTRKKASIEQVIAFGNRIAAQINAVLENVGTTDVTTLEISEYTINLKTSRAIHPYEQEVRKIEKEIHKEQSKQVALGLETFEVISKNIQSMTHYPIDFFHIQINGYHFVTFPGELYSSLLGEDAYDLNVRVIGYTNGYCLYLPDEHAFMINNYEALSSIFQKGQGEKFYTFIKKLVITS